MQSTITPADIHWLPAAAPVDGKRCPVCRHATGHLPLLTVPAMAPPHQALTLLRCSDCGSGFYDPPDIRDFSDLGQDRDDFWRIYVESFCGIWEMIWPILADSASGARTFLDVGCGMGFALNFWKRANGGEAVGVELADYGVIGAKLLDVTIYQEFLQDCKPLAGRRFDVVYASEVIEHVPDPAAFVAMLAERVANDGILVLTTPCSAFAVPENQSATLLAALAPGFHGFLLSPHALGGLARKAGFASVDVRVFGERQVLWASRFPRSIDHDPAKLRPVYLNYLAERLAIDDDSSSLWQGLAYRCVRDLAGTGRLAEAKAVATRLMSALEHRFGAAIRDPAEIAKQLACCESLAHAGEVAPYFMPCLYYHLGSIAQNVDADRRRALELFSGAAEMSVACVRMGSIFYLEAISLLWPARVAAAILQLSGDDAAAGAQLLARLGDEGRILSATNGYALASEDYVESTLTTICEALSMRGQNVEADTVFKSYLRHVERHYGSLMLTEAGIEDAMRRAEAPLPRDPFFALWFEGLRNPWIAGSPGGQSEPNPALLGFVRLSEALATDSRIGLNAPDRVLRARQLLAVPAMAQSRVLYDFSYTIRPPAS